MSASTHIGSDLELPRAPVRRVRVVTAAVRAGDHLAVDQELTGRWEALEETVRNCVAAVFGRGRATNARTSCADESLPRELRRDVARGGRGLRSAFPHMTRRVVEVADGPGVTSVRVQCEGEHTGPFFGVLSPTHWRVQFDVLHRLVAHECGPVEHAVSLDLRAIVLQLVAPRAASRAP